MAKKIEKTCKEITTYLSKFKDANGDEPDILKVAFMIEQYCNLYVEGLNKYKAGKG